MSKKGFILLEGLQLFTITITPVILLCIDISKRVNVQNTVDLYAKAVEVEFMLQNLRGNADAILPKTGEIPVAPSILMEVNMDNKPICESVTVDSFGYVSVYGCTVDGISNLSSTTAK